MGIRTRALVAMMGMALFAGSASASLLAKDDASDPAYNDGWQTGDNGGTGWGGGWTFRNGGNALIPQPDPPTAAFQGTFIGDARGNNSPAGAGGDSNSDGDINVLGEAWGMYANSANELYAIRPFSGALSVGQTVAFDFDNGNVDSTRVLGVRLLANTADISTRQVELRFVGGDANYTVFSGGTPPTLGSTGFTREGIHAEFTLTGTNTFSLLVKRLQSNTTQTVTGTLVSPGGNNAINGIAFRNLSAGGGATNDGYFNSIAIPEPSSLGLIAFCLLLSANRAKR